VNCPACGTPNVPGALTCARCDTPLAGPPGAAPEGAPAGTPAPDQPSWAAPPGGQPAAAPSGDQWAAPGAAYPPPGAPAPSGDQWAAPQAPQPAASGEAWPPQQYPAPSGDAWPPQGQQPPPGQAWGAPAGGYGGPPGGGYAPPGYGGPPPGGGGGGSRRTLLIVLGVLVVLALGAGAFILLSGGDEGDEVVLEPIGSVQEDDFAGNLDVGDLAAAAQQATTDAPEFGTQAVAALSSRTATGNEPGLYGGTQDNAVCDTAQLVAFLTDPANSAQAEAWAEVNGIDVGGIGEFVDGLTAVRLRFDTRVTNHGFRDGGANPFQSLLQAGTAVLVDEQGVPRVKCNCGNPLLAPEDGEGGTIEDVAQNPDDAWEGLDTANVLTVEGGGEAVGEFTLVDNTDGALYTRPIGSDGSEDGELADFGDVCETYPDSPTCGGNIDLGEGSMQVTLEWESSADLDLHVIEPDGNELYYSNTGPSASGGQLDVDSNVGCDPDGSVENVFYNSAPPSGSYTIEVVGYDVGAEAGASNECGGGEYTLTIRVEGREDEVHEGTVGDQETQSYDVSL
jgi:hypothetical protein